MFQIQELILSIKALTDEIEIGTEHSSTSLYIAFITHSGFDYTKLRSGNLPNHTVAYQAYILADATSVLTQNGSVDDQMLLETLIRQSLAITIMLTTQQYRQQFVWNNTLMFISVEHLGQFSVRTTPELKPFKIAIDELINT